LLDNTVGVVVQRGCAKWRARVITNWLLILISRAAKAFILSLIVRSDVYFSAGCLKQVMILSTCLLLAVF